FEVYASGSWHSCSTATGQAPAGTWTHVAGTYDGATGVLFVNGVQKCTFAYSGSIASGSSPVLVGQGYYSWEMYAGAIDEVRIYPGARTATQVAGDAATTAVNDPSTVAA